MKKVLLIIALFMFKHIYAQEVCIGDKKVDNADINEIAISKCTIDEFNIEASTKENTSLIYSKRFNKKKKRKKNNFTSVTQSNPKIKLPEIKKNIGNIISVVDKKNTIVSFLKVEKTPKFINHQDSFNSQMKLHLDKYLQYPKEALKKGVEGKLLVQFIITKQGEVKNVEILPKTANIILKKEAFRVVALLPKLYPAKHKGEKVNMSYSFPMHFTLN